VVTVSSDIQNVLVNKLGFKEESIQVIHNGVEIPNDSPGKKKNNRFVIGSSGRLFPVKDYPFMVEVARAVQKMGGKVLFELAGDGPDGPKVRALINRYGLNGTFVLKWHLDNLTAFYQDIDLYLNTSIHEGIPMGVLEAMAHGLPVVAPKVGGLPEIIDEGVQGFLIEKRNPHLFGEKCMLLCDNHALWKDMSSAAREKACRSFSLQKMAEGYYQLYRQVMSHS